MLKNLWDSESNLNGIVFHNWKVKGLELNELIESLILFFTKQELEFTVLDVNDQEEVQNKDINSPGFKESKKNLKENENIEGIFAVIELLHLDKETRELIQERINDAYKEELGEGS